MIDALIACISGAIGAWIYNRLTTSKLGNVTSKVGNQVGNAEGPFLHRKSTARRKPVAHDEVEEWRREQESRRGVR